LPTRFIATTLTTDGHQPNNSLRVGFTCSEQPQPTNTENLKGELK
jgi:hypothetical protein